MIFAGTPIEALDKREHALEVALQVHAGRMSVRQLDENGWIAEDGWTSEKSNALLQAITCEGVGHSGVRFRGCRKGYALDPTSAAAPFLHLHLLASNEARKPGNADAWIKYAGITPGYLKGRLTCDVLQKHLESLWEIERTQTGVILLKRKPSVSLDDLWKHEFVLPKILSGDFEGTHVLDSIFASKVVDAFPEWCAPLVDELSLVSSVTRGPMSEQHQQQARHRADVGNV